MVTISIARIIFDKDSSMPVAICFYTPESWVELKKVAADKKKLDDTYADWLTGFHNAMNGLKKEGIHPIPLAVDIQDLEQWCKKHNKKNNSASRALYASEKAHQIANN